MIPERLIRRAVDVARNGPGTGKRKNWKVGAVLFDNRHRVLTAKPNLLKTHPLLSTLTKYPYLHAETNCVISHGLDNCSGHSLLCVRIIENGSLSMSKPCKVCRQILETVGINKVYYSDWKGNIACNS